MKSAPTASLDRRHRVILLLLVASTLVGVAPSRVGAQTAGGPCDYDRCALGVLPRFTALDIVRGRREERVGSLSFLWPRDPRSAFADSPQSVAHVSTAVSRRRVAAVLTDLGIGAIVAGAAVAASGHSARLPVGLAAAGALSLGVSVPVQFSADAELSRAVWEYNRRFIR